MSKRKATTSSEFLLHQYLWMYAQSLLKLRDHQVGPRDALECSACLLLAFAVEAHANRMLEVGFPSEYADERGIFSSGVYVGTIGKLEFLAFQWKLDLHRGSAPLQSVCELFSWRDRMTHPRVERIVREVSYVDPDTLNPPNSKVLTVPANRCASFFQDSESVCDMLQAAAHAARLVGIYSPRAFKGMLGQAGITLENDGFTA